MLQNPCKTLDFKKNMVYEIPPGGGGKPYPASGLIILVSEISQPDYVHLNTCNNVQIMHSNANIDESRYFVWFISMQARDGILLSDFLISNYVLGGYFMNEIKYGNL